MSHYIHVVDPGFPGGFRRLGPYGSKGDADTQAAHDEALGHLVEVVAAKESDARLAKHHAEGGE